MLSLLVLGGIAWLSIAVFGIFLLRDILRDRRPAGGVNCSLAERLGQRTLAESDLGGAFDEHFLLDAALIDNIDEGWLGRGDSGRDLEAASLQRGGYGSKGYWLRALQESRYRRGWKTSWFRPGSSSELVAEVLEFESSGGAASFQGSAQRFSCRFFTDVFSVPQVPDAVGAQYRVEEDGKLFIADQASFVVKNRRFLIALYEEGAKPDRGSLGRLLVNARELAGHPPNGCETLGSSLSDLEQRRSSGGGETDVRLDQALTSEGPVGFELEQQAEGAVVTVSSGATDSFHRSWRMISVRLTAEVAEFPDSAASYAELFRSALARCGRAAAIWKSHAAEGSVGVVVVDAAEVRNFLAFVRGTRLYAIEVVGPTEQIPQEIYSDFVPRAARLAR